MNTHDHQKAVDLEHKLKVAAAQAKDDCHNGVIILALRVLEQRTGLPSSATPEPSTRDLKPGELEEERVPATSIVEAAAFARDVKYQPAIDLLQDLETAINALDRLRHTTKRLKNGLDAGTYPRRCTDGYAKACRDRDMIDPRALGGMCDACRKQRERDRDERRTA